MHADILFFICKAKIKTAENADASQTQRFLSVLCDISKSAALRSFEPAAVPADEPTAESESMILSN